ncbi:hypothetical protein [Phyllobacterium brassicacearum]|nr:hypothetical protein [Phyllobacterium brassicacearum]
MSNRYSPDKPTKFWHVAVGAGLLFVAIAWLIVPLFFIARI